MSNVSLSELLEAGVHFGHKSCLWNPKMFPYIYTEINNKHIIDLVKSARLLKKAKGILQQYAANRKTFLFVGTKPQVNNLIVQEANRCDSFYVNHRWLGGMLTNWSTIEKRISKLKFLEQQEADKAFSLLTKKEMALRRKELQKLRKHLNGIKEMKKIPDIVIVIDQNHEMTAVQECRKLNIPVVSILDTNCNPDLIDIPIPGNDDGIRSIKLILQTLTDGILDGKKKS